MTLAERPHRGNVAPRHEREQRVGFLFGVYFPPSVLTNEEIASWGITTESGKFLSSEDIFKKVGVLRRSIANDRETAFAMGKHAASFVVNQATTSIDAVLFTTSYPTGQHNSTEIIRTFHLEADDAIDIHAACSGFALALTYLKDNEARFLDKGILIVASEKYSTTLPDLQSGEKDPSLSQTIFADGAITISFVYDKDLRVLGYKNYRFPDEVASSICMPIDYDLVRQPALVVDVPLQSGKFWMDGKKVYETMVQLHPKQLLGTLESVGLTPDDIALVIPHQASLPMLDGVAKRLPSLKGKILYDLADGNYSSASIPKALMQALREQRVKPGDIVVFDGFGAGLFASIVVAQLGPKAEVQHLKYAA